MEGAGKQGLRTPLSPISHTLRTEVSSAVAALAGTGTSHHPRHQQQRPNKEAVNNGSPFTRQGGPFDREGGGGGEEHQHFTSSIPAAPGTASGATASSSSSSSQAAKANWGGSGGGPSGENHHPQHPQSGEGGSSSNISILGSTNGVWAIVHSLALLHCDTAIALAASSSSSSTGGPPSIELAAPQGEAVSMGPTLPHQSSSAAAALNLASGGGGYVPLGDGSRINLVSSMACLRGGVLMACDNRGRAAQWLVAALRVDPYNVSAFNVSQRKSLNSVPACLPSLLFHITKFLSLLFLHTHTLPFLHFFW